MKIVNKRKFIRSVVIIGIFVAFISLIFANKTLSHTETSYQKIYVSSGDTLWNISKEQKKSNPYFEEKDIRTIVDEIKYTNNLNNSDLEIGQELNIPII